MRVVGKITAKSETVIRIAVQEPDSKQREIFNVTSLKTLYHARHGDLVDATIKKENGGWIFTKQPYVTTELGDEKVIVGTFISIFTTWDDEQKKSILKVPAGKLKAIYHHFAKECVGVEVGTVLCESVSEYLTAKSGQLWEGDRISCIESILDTGLTLLTCQEISRLLQGWHYRHDNRLLFLLGVAEKQIDASHQYSGILYNSIIENPYYVTCIPIDTAKTISKIINKQFEGTDKIIGSLLRLLRKETIDRDDTCIDTEKFFDRHETYNLRETLLKEHIVCQDNFLYD